MLQFLSIRDFAIIEQVELEFGPGFTVISGETGAGKSILIDALGLLLGDRANASQVAQGRSQADLSAEFNLTDQTAARAWLEDQAMLDEDRLLLRRVLAAGGGSRAWINGRSATIGQLSELGAMLVEIHGQHEHQLLSRPAEQRQILDRQVESATLAAVGQAYRAWRTALGRVEEFERDCGDPAQLELLQFQHRELESLDLQPGEYERLEQEQERLARSDEIQSCLQRTRAALADETAPNARDLLRSASQSLAAVAHLDQQLNDISAVLNEAEINLDEALSSLDRLDPEAPDDPQALAALNQRLETTLDLARKHRVRPDELPELTTRLGQRLAQLTDQDQRREALQQDLKTSRSAWQDAADRLSQARTQAADELAAAAAQKLAALGMSGARLAVRVNQRAKPDPAEHGQDDIAILFSANAGQAPQPLNRVASGGELSRVSLALMIAARPPSEQPARIFDEVDAGIGGETAHVVGQFLRAAAGDSQAFCVTHLAQVAARADHQFKVSKSEQSGRTVFSIEALDQAGRERELARMLGDRDSAGSLAHAREMLAGQRK